MVVGSYSWQKETVPLAHGSRTSVSLGLVRAEPVFAIVGFLFYPITLSMVANQFAFTIDGTGLHHLKVEGHITTGLLVRLAVAVGIKSNV